MLICESKTDKNKLSIMNSLVIKLEEKLLPEFQKIANRINQTIPNVKASVYGSSAGSLTNYQGYDFFIDCILTAYILYEAEEVADNVALSVGLCHLTTTPRISADVCWGHPSGHCEADFPDYWIGSSNDWLIVSDKVLEDLYKDLPRLYEALFEALRRRIPGDE